MANLYERYKSWVRQNGNVLSVLETGASSLTWVLPDRFSEHELSLEAVHTAINLISAFHDSIMNDPGPGAPAGATELSFALAALQQAEVLVELWSLWAEQRGRIRNRYDPLIAIEGLKALVRLTIMHRSHARILTNGGSTAFDAMFMGTAEGKPAEVYAAFAAFRRKHCFEPPAHPAVSKALSRLGMLGGLGDTTRKGASTRSSRQEDATQEGDQQQRYWWETPPSCLGATVEGGAAIPTVAAADALRSLESWAATRQFSAARVIIASEILHVLRPLLYVLALRRWGRRSWKSWSLSLAVELASIRLSAAGAAGSQAAAAAAAEHPAIKGTSLALLYGLQGVRWTREEADELTRRKLLLLYYLVRDPFFSRYTQPAIQTWTNALRRIPLAGWAADKAVEVLFGAQRYYTYTAAS